MAAIVFYSINARSLGQPLACLQCESRAAAVSEQAFYVGGLSNGTAPERSLQWQPELLTVPPDLVVDQLPWLAPLSLAAQQKAVVL